MRNAYCYVLDGLFEVLVFAGRALFGLEFIVDDVEGEIEIGLGLVWD